MDGEDLGVDRAYRRVAAGRLRSRKYQNRGIIDGFGGVRGSEQWTVRGSRELASAPEEMGVGPVQLEVVEPLKQMRFRLEPNDVQPISFDIVCPRLRHRSSRSATLFGIAAPAGSASIIRYHQEAGRRER
jgi:hypothetical protein